LRYIIHCNKNWIQWIIASIIKNGWGKWWFSWTGWIILMGSIPCFRWKMMIQRLLKVIGFGGIPLLRRILCRTLPQAWTKQYMLRWDPGSFLEASQDPKKYVEEAAWWITVRRRTCLGWTCIS
jgi:hypothetical protein